MEFLILRRLKRLYKMLLWLNFILMFLDLCPFMEITVGLVVVQKLKFIDNTLYV